MTRIAASTAVCFYLLLFWLSLLLTASASDFLPSTATNGPRARVVIAERKDSLLYCEAGGLDLKGDFAPVFERQERGGAMALGSFTL